MSILNKSSVHTTGVATRTWIKKVGTVNGVKGLILYRDHKPNTPATSDTIAFAAGAHNWTPNFKYKIQIVKVGAGVSYSAAASTAAAVAFQVNREERKHHKKHYGFTNPDYTLNEQGCLQWMY